MMPARNPAIALTLIFAAECVAAACAAPAGEAAPRAAAAAVPADAAEILSFDSNWRWSTTFRKPEVVAPAGQEAPAQKVIRGADAFVSPPPPAGWTAPDFADAGWSSTTGRGLEDAAFHYYSTSVVCLRGRFLVTDPAAVKGLYLTLRYRGGVAVCLNGQEVARGDLPEGALSPETAAAPYGEDVFLDKSGKPPLLDDYRRGRLPADEKKDHEERIARRVRSLGPVALPVSLLRKGVNVVAFELHRSDYPPAVIKWEAWFARNASTAGIRPVAWPTVALVDARLQASGSGAAPNVARPRGAQVWVRDRNDRVTEQDYGDPCEAGLPLVLAGARNGSFCGQLVVGSTEPVKDLVVKVEDLAPAKGGSTGSPPEALSLSKGGAAIPASAVTVLWGLFDRGSRGGPRWADGLQEEPPAEVPVSKAGAAVQTVLLRLRVPRDAAPGEYRGTVKISSASFGPLAVPVTLSVADWVVPDPKQYRTYIGVYQSPTTLATKYKVPEWSEEHWKLMDKSLALLGRIGNKMVNVCVVDRTQFGNEEGMVIWKKRADGSYTYDFTVFDRFLALALKHCGTLDYVALQIWHSGGWEARKADQENTVTVVDEATGARSHLQVPVFDTEESKRFWKPFLDQVHERLKKLGLEKAMCIGILSDGTAPDSVFKAFDEIWPGGAPARWTRGLHSAFRVQPPYPHEYKVSKAGGAVVLHEFCYGNALAEPEKPLPPISKFRGCPGTMYWRLQSLEDAGTLVWNRTLAEQSLFRYNQGVGRVCLDFWPLSRDDGGGSGAGTIYNRYPSSSCAQRAPALFHMTWPGPKGAETTVRFEAFSEGIQLAEADIVVSEALETHEADLGAELAGECRRLLVERLWYLHSRDRQDWGKVYFRLDHRDWQELDRRLFECAAKVSARLKK